MGIVEKFWTLFENFGCGFGLDIGLYRLGLGLMSKFTVITDVKLVNASITVAKANIKHTS